MLGDDIFHAIVKFRSDELCAVQPHDYLLFVLWRLWQYLVSATRVGIAFPISSLLGSAYCLRLLRACGLSVSEAAIGVLVYAFFVQPSLKPPGKSES